MAKPAVGWFEVTGKDGPALQKFYGDLFTWEFQEGGGGYGMVQAEPGSGGIGGGIGPAQDGAGLLTFYVEVADVAEYLSKAEQLGGKTVMPSTEIAEFHLTFGLFADPEGHVVGLMHSAAQ